MSSFIGAMTRMGMRLRRDKCIRSQKVKAVQVTSLPLPHTLTYGL